MVVVVDFAAVREHIRQAIARIEPDDSPRALTKAGAEVIHGDSVSTTRPTGGRCGTAHPVHARVTRTLLRRRRML